MNHLAQGAYATARVFAPTLDVKFPAFASARWRLRFRLADLAIAVRAGRDAVPREGETWQVSGHCGHAAFSVVLPAPLLEALFARAPDPVTPGELAHDDAALLLEHLLCAPLEQLEARLKLPVIFQQIEISRQENVRQENVRQENVRQEKSWQEKSWPEPRVGDIALDIDVSGQIFPVTLTVLDPALRVRLHEEITRLEAAGPDGVPGMAVAVGPVLLSRSEIESLGAGDQLVLDGASIERLQGAVFLDDALYWPITLVDGAIEVSGALVTVPSTPVRQPQGPLPLFFHVGLTGGSSPMQKGNRVPLQRFEDSKMMLKLGRQVIGVAALANKPEGITLCILNREGST